ncbi:hypothetical protein IGJ29_001127 [Enterococcus sp. DIV2461a]|nr:hypothetical protein D927_02174 [Enterococcus faecalis 02-MB-BW-10]GMC12565.1 hypothetical protein L3D_20110 [Enterococcus faecalis]
MKSLNNMINIITFEQAKKNINYDILLENISGEKNTLLSYSIKKK